MRVTTTIWTEYTLDQRLDLDIPEIPLGRGAHYNPQHDPDAYAKAQGFFNRSAAAIRAKAKTPELPIALSLELRGEGIYAVVSGKTVKRQEGK